MSFNEQSKRKPPELKKESGMLMNSIPTVIKPDMSMVRKAREEDMPLIDHVNFSESVANWDTVARDFVLRVGTKKRVALFIEQMGVAKRQVERKMRRELDLKIVQMKSDKLLPAIGKDIMDKVRYYSRKYRLHLNV